MLARCVRCRCTVDLHLSVLVTVQMRCRCSIAVTSGGLCQEISNGWTPIELLYKLLFTVPVRCRSWTFRPSK